MKQPSRTRLLRISLIYAAATTIWIVVSDRLITLLTQDVEQQALLQTIKGLLFIAFTTVLIYTLLRRELRLEEEVIAALGDSEAQWRSLVENAPDIIYTVNRQGDILFINHPVAGLTHQDVLGTNVLAYTPPELSDDDPRGAYPCFRNRPTRALRSRGARPPWHTRLVFNRAQSGHAWRLRLRRDPDHPRHHRPQAGRAGAAGERSEAQAVDRPCPRLPGHVRPRHALPGGQHAAGSRTIPSKGRR